MWSIVVGTWRASKIIITLYRVRGCNESSEMEMVELLQPAASSRSCITIKILFQGFGLSFYCIDFDDDR